MVAVTANTGNGGDGAGLGAPTYAGASGVVVVRYLTAEATLFTISGGTKTTSGSYTVHTFTASGSLVIA
jgi:hypothetical protein